MSHQRADEAFNAELRAIQIIDLASQLATDGYRGSVEDSLEQFIEELVSDSPMHASLQPLAKFIKDNESFANDEDDPDFEIDIGDAGELLAEGHFYGFAVQFGTPIRRYIGNGSSAWYSGWGLYYTRWVYAKTFADAWQLGLAWAKERNQHDLAKKGGAA